MRLIFSILLLHACALHGQNLFTKASDPNNPLLNFTNTAANYKGCAWIDLDGDNWPDIFVSQRFLFKNLGDGQFQALPDVEGATTGQSAAGSSWADVDNDGDLDCITASRASGLHMNKGDQTFTLRNDLLANFTDYPAWDCSLADADNDGRLDLFFAHAAGFHGQGPFPCRFYLQNAIGGFDQVTQGGYEFLTQNRPYTIPMWMDFDLDGDMDLFIGSGPGGSPGPDFIYKNLLKETGDFALERITTPPFNSMQDGQVYNAIDFDNDGDLDICLTNYSGAKTRLYVNQNSNYVETSTPFTVQAGLLANAWGDFDNDGDLDLLITRDGSNAISYYENKGTFFAEAQTAGTSSVNACGLAIADYDNDGDLDFFINGSGNARALFQNDSLAANRHWAQFSLQGVESNRSAIGATLLLKAVINGSAVWQTRQVLAHNSFQSQHDLRQHFGLNDATVIDSLVIKWPSGMVQSFSGLSADRFYRAVEGQPLVTLGVKESSRTKTLSVSPNPAGNNFRLTAERPITWAEAYDTVGRRFTLHVVPWENGADATWPISASAGAYFVRAGTSDGTIWTGRLIKQ